MPPATPPRSTAAPPSSVRTASSTAPTSATCTSAPSTQALPQHVAVFRVPHEPVTNYHITSVGPIIADRVRAPGCLYSDRSEAEMLLVVYHADADSTAEQLTSFLSNHLVGAPRARAVAVLTCWVNAAEQTRALKNFSYAHRDLLVIAHRTVDLVCTTQMLSETLLHLAQAVHDESPYLALSKLCTLLSRTVLFEGGVGPYQVAYPGMPLCSCGAKYPSAGSKRKSKESSVRRRKCRAIRACVDLLLVGTHVYAVKEGAIARSTPHPATMLGCTVSQVF